MFFLNKYNFIIFVSIFCSYATQTEVAEDWVLLNNSEKIMLKRGEVERLEKTLKWCRNYWNKKEKENPDYTNYLPKNMQLTQISENLINAQEELIELLS